MTQPQKPALVDVFPVETGVRIELKVKNDKRVVGFTLPLDLAYLFAQRVTRAAMRHEEGDYRDMP